jgi:hypothetical protein
MEESSTKDVEEIIEIDFGMISGAKAKRVKNLHINERFMKTGVNEVKLTPRELKKVFLELKQLEDNVETIHVDLDSTQITGFMLGSCITKKITDLQVKGGLVLMNQEDRTALGRALYQHEFLRQITLQNLIVKERLVNRWNSNPSPPLDILVPAFTSITFLNVLALSCANDNELPVIPDKSKPSTAPLPPRPMFSLLGIKELVHTLTLECLELSGLGLTDDHYGVLIEQVSQGSSTSFLTTLILNENSHTSLALDMLASLLYKSDCKLEHLECYQSGSIVEGASLLLYEQAVVENTTVKQLRIHLWGDVDDGRLNKHNRRIPFFLELNRKGRKRLGDKKTTTAQWMDLMVGVKDDPALLFHFLQNSRFWWTCRDIPKLRPKDFVMPSIQIVTPPGSSSARSATGALKSSRGLNELKDRHRELLNGIELSVGLGGDDVSLGDGKDLVTSDITRELEAKKIPQILTIGNVDDALENSAVSLGAESYINDLMHQQEKRPREAREEVLEDALEELDYVLKHDKLPPGMSKELYFHKVVERLQKEKTRELAKQDRKFDSLLKKALLAELAKEKVSEGKVGAAAEDTAAMVIDDKVEVPAEENQGNGEQAENPVDNA